MEATYSLDVYTPVVILLFLGAITVVAALLLGKLVRPHNPSESKNTPYECGEQPVGTAWSFFNMRFYVIGLIFIIFDVESALMFPVAVIFKKMNEIGRGGLVLVEIMIFLSVLISGIAYCWRKGDLDWVKSYVPSKDTNNKQG
ncbi:MAG: NADH-quinone oxidoreductase subunit A [Bacteriovoracaceae bacterium]